MFDLTPRDRLRYLRMGKQSLLRIPLEALNSESNWIVWTVLGIALCLLLLSTSVTAQDTPRELRKIARNPFADVLKVPVEEDVTFTAGPFNRNANSLQLQPVIPLQMTNGLLLISRILATTVVYQPDLGQKSGGSTGWGDINSTFFFTPAHVKKVIWGMGPSLLIPTATETELGAGKWGIGPSGVVLVEPAWGSASMLVRNIWSIAGDSKRQHVNQMEFDLSFSYNLPNGWYLTSGPSIAADWTQQTGERWLVPFGGGAGRSLNIGKQALDWNLTLYRNAIRPASQASPKWQLNLQFTLLYPKQARPAAR